MVHQTQSGRGRNEEKPGLARGGIREVGPIGIRSGMPALADPFPFIVLAAMLFLNCSTNGCTESFEKIIMVQRPRAMTAGQPTGFFQIGTTRFISSMSH